MASIRWEDVLYDCEQLRNNEELIHKLKRLADPFHFIALPEDTQLLCLRSVLPDEYIAMILRSFERVSVYISLCICAFSIVYTLHEC